MILGCTLKYQWDAIHDPRKILAWAQDEDEGAFMALPDDETIALLQERLYNKIFKGKYAIKDLWAEEEKLKIIKDINGQVLELFYIKNESGVFKWDYPRFYSDKGVDQSTFDPRTASEEFRKECEREYSLANYIIKNYTDLLLKPISTYQSSFDAFAKYFYDVKKLELGSDIFKYPWIDGSTNEIIDPRNYYKNGAYEFNKLENDVKEFVLLKEEKYVNPASEEIGSEKLMRFNSILSMYGEYMYYMGVNEIPRISPTAVENLKPGFFRYWDNTETQQWGFYWTWNTLRQERIAAEKARLIAQMQFEQDLASYLKAVQEGKVQAWLDIGFGAATMTGSILAIVFTEGGASTLTYVSMGFAADQIAGGINMLYSIKNGFFEENKEYKIVKGLLMNSFEDEVTKQKVDVIYDLSSIFFGVLSAGKTVKDITLNGSDIEKIINGYASGAETVNVIKGSQEFVIKLNTK